MQSNRKSPGVDRWVGTCAAATWSLKESRAVAELLRHRGRLSSECVRVVPPSENNWPVPAPIHQSDSTWPRGNEWINKGERIQCADEVEPAGPTLSLRTVSVFTIQPLLAKWHRVLHKAPSSETISDGDSKISSVKSPLSPRLIRQLLLGCCHSRPGVCTLTKTGAVDLGELPHINNPFSTLTVNRRVFVCTPCGYRKVCFTPHYPALELWPATHSLLIIAFSCLVTYRLACWCTSLPSMCNSQEIRGTLIRRQSVLLRLYCRHIEVISLDPPPSYESLRIEKGNYCSALFCFCIQAVWTVFVAENANECRCLALLLQFVYFNLYL